jgi:hypothetical protein
MIDRSSWEEGGRAIVAYQNRLRKTGEEFLTGLILKPAVGLKTNIMAKRRVTEEDIWAWIRHRGDLEFSYREAKNILEWEKMGGRK